MHHDLVLTAADVRLEPLAPGHADRLLALVDDAMWLGMTTPTPRTAEDVEAWIATALHTPGRYAFTVTGPEGEVRGSSSFYDVDLAVGRCEIGHTFYGRPWWGGTTNPATKLAMLTHAFEGWGMHRVALRADARNERSQRAIARLGATREGVLRGHRVAADGTRGDTVYWSVLAPEWPGVRDGLVDRLG